MFKQNSILLVIVVCLFSAVGTVRAAPPGQADLDVEFLGQNSPWVYSTYTYRVRVHNTGGRNANNVNVTVDFPLTNTSPQIFILGNLSGVDSRCQIISNKLECDLGRIRRGRSKTLRFEFEFPYADRSLDMTATASTTSSEQNQANNQAVKSPSVRYPQNLINSGDFTISFCAGQNLTSYFECTLFPTSTQSLSVNLDSNGTVSFPDNPYMTGSWYQLGTDQLVITTTNGTSAATEFKGYAVSANCFEGINTYPNSSSGYIAPSRICLQ